MSKEFINELNVQFARRTLQVFIDHAVRTCDELGIQEFIMVPTSKDLRVADTRLASGVRYMVLPGGDFIIHSAAMQQLVVSHGMTNALPWVQNMVNPRLKCSIVNGRILAEINRGLLTSQGGVELNPGPTCRYCLASPTTCWVCWSCASCCRCGEVTDDLLRCGDVESNPGPARSWVFGVCVAVVVGIWCHSQPQWLHHSLRDSIGLSVCTADGSYTCRDTVSYSVAIVQGVGNLCRVATYPIWYWLESQFTEWALACAHSERMRLDLIDAWRGTISGPWMYALYGLGLVPAYSEILRPPVMCQIGSWIHDPQLIEQVGWSPYYYIWWVAVIMWSSCTLSVVGCSWWTLWFLTKKRGITKVVNHNKGLDINQLKDELKQFNYNRPQFIKGKHVILAGERRSAEMWCFNQLLARFDRVRDVGGSRSRWIELGHQKHICAPVFSNDDILREEKSFGAFENCKELGQFCPLRTIIPAAVLSHVDYHMTQSELVAVVTGPTFIINHDFVSRPTRFGCSGDEFEASVVVSDDSVVMRPHGGTRYCHSYHKWGSEGSVVTDSGAFQYVCIGKLGDTQILYCVPADGCYRRQDTNVLPPTEPKVFGVGDGFTATYDSPTGVYKFTHCVEPVEFDIPAGIISDASLVFMTAPRNNKYVDTVRSYVSGKLRSEGIELLYLNPVFRCVMVLADNKALTLLPDLSVIVGDPKDFSFLNRLKCRAVLWVKRITPIAGDILGDLITKWAWGPIVCPWMFNTVYVPTYEVMVGMKSSRHVSGRALEYNNNRFRVEAAPVNASCHKRGVGRTCQDLPECDDVSRDTGIESGSEACDVVNVEEVSSASSSSTDVGTPAVHDESRCPSPFDWAASCAERQDAGPSGTCVGGSAPGGVSSHTAVPERPPSTFRGNLLEKRPITVSTPDDSESEVVVCIDSPALPKSSDYQVMFRPRTSAGKAYLAAQRASGTIADFCLCLEELVNRFPPTVRDASGQTLLAVFNFVLGCADGSVDTTSPVTFVRESCSVLCYPRHGNVRVHGAFGFQDVEFAVPESPPATTGRSAGKSGVDGRGRTKGRGKKFSQNRNVD
uniref:Chroparavirus methyltransferase domain-containing protein n=1 Tax=Riboviria sp. TaxID=2585031 RepID=A0A8K1U2V4_9VIRU|nr:MAG: hypothetical protein 2 [Riboviria sp.]